MADSPGTSRITRCSNRAHKLTFLLHVFPLLWAAGGKCHT